jgi:hypothetical protein
MITTTAPRKRDMTGEPAFYMQPSPSLGPPWLSASLSPPPFCGMQLPDL